MNQYMHLKISNKNFERTRLFSLKNPNTLQNIRETLEIIKNAMNKNCGPLPSIPEIYFFKQNIVLGKLLYLLKELNYKLLKQILNYDGKVIGVIISKSNKSGFIPCAPIIVDY